MPILSLPSEILLLITTHLRTPDLNCLSQTNKSLNNLTQPLLYRSIQSQTFFNRPIRLCTRALSGIFYPYLSTAQGVQVRELHLSVPGTTDLTEQRGERERALLNKCTKLRKLHIRIDTSRVWTEIAEDFQRRQAYRRLLAFHRQVVGRVAGLRELSIDVVLLRDMVKDDAPWMAILGRARSLQRLRLYKAVFTPMKVGTVLASLLASPVKGTLRELVVCWEPDTRFLPGNKYQPFLQLLGPGKFPRLRKLEFALETTGSRATRHGWPPPEYRNVNLKGRLLLDLAKYSKDSTWEFSQWVQILLPEAAAGYKAQYRLTHEEILAWGHEELAEVYRWFEVIIPDWAGEVYIDGGEYWVKPGRMTKLQYASNNLLAVKKLGGANLPCRVYWSQLSPPVNTHDEDQGFERYREMCSYLTSLTINLPLWRDPITGTAHIPDFKRWQQWLSVILPQCKKLVKLQIIGNGLAGRNVSQPIGPRGLEIDKLHAQITGLCKGHSLRELVVDVNPLAYTSTTHEETLEAVLDVRETFADGNPDTLNETDVPEVPEYISIPRIWHRMRLYLRFLPKLTNLTQLTLHNVHIADNKPEHFCLLHLPALLPELKSFVLTGEFFCCPRDPSPSSGTPDSNEETFLYHEALKMAQNLDIAVGVAEELLYSRYKHRILAKMTADAKRARNESVCSCDIDIEGLRVMRGDGDNAHTQQAFFRNILESAVVMDSRRARLEFQVLS